MIIVPTNNGRNYIYSCVLRLQQYVKDVPVTIVDTHSSDKSYTDEIRELCKDVGFNFLQCDRPGYDFGAIKLAYQTFPATTWFWFQHDSVYIKSSNLIYDVRQKLQTNDMVALTFFHPSDCFYDNEEQRKFVNDNCGDFHYQNGIYGPNFGINKQALDKMWSDISKIEVTTKLQQQAMERGWAVLANKYGLKISKLEEHDFKIPFFDNNLYTYFDKAKHAGRMPRQ